MAYTFRNTERNLPIGSEYETRALLYLISISKVKEDVHYIFIDCFNDVSGAGESCDQIFDIQAKGVKSLTPNTIGQSLITLFQNFLTKFNFSIFILYVYPINPKYLLDSSKKDFQLENFGKYQKKVRDGLRNFYLKKNSESSGLEGLDLEIEDFFKKIYFVQDSKTKDELVRGMTSFSPTESENILLFENIFEEIQNLQLGKKNKKIEGEIIESAYNALSFNKHVQTKDIQTMIVNRVVGAEVFKNKSIPISFKTYVEDMDDEDIKDLIDKCNSQLSKALFDKTSKRDFWMFLEKAIELVKINPHQTDQSIYEQIENTTGIKSQYMRGISGVYLISLIKTGFE